MLKSFKLNLNFKFNSSGRRRAAAATSVTLMGPEPGGGAPPPARFASGLSPMPRPGPDHPRPGGRATDLTRDSESEPSPSTFKL